MVLPIPPTLVLFKNIWAQSVFRKNDEVHPARAECVMRYHQNTSLLVLSVLLLPVGCLAQSSGAAKSTETLATVGGQSITEDDLPPSVASKLIAVRNLEYQVKKQALDNLIDQRLLEAEAKRKGIAADKFLEQEVDAKVAEPTDAELNAYYLARKAELNRPLDEAKAQIEPSLKQAKIQQARQAFYAYLREQAKVVVLLSPPRIEVSFDPARVRGNPKAKVMIVEFSDFQCPYCSGVQATLKSVLAKHPDTVALAYRDMPMSKIHPLARKAAEAARCAGEQGKFWEYHDLVFADQSKLDQAGLMDKARTLNLNEQQFESCLSGEKFKAQIQQDSQDGMRAGVSGTPGFFINGIFLSGSQPASAFENLVQEQLSAPPLP
jgi:protein-disulfide isomerase